MPATTGTHALNELEIYNALKLAGLNTAAACGVLANIWKESGFKSINLQDSYNTSLGYTDQSYTKAVDNRSYSAARFASDSAGYGLAQWTYSTRKKSLYNYASQKKTSIGNLTMQIEFLIRELQGKTPYQDFKKVWDDLRKIENTRAGAYKAGHDFCRDFENPADKSSYVTRGQIARDTFWSYYSNLSHVETAKSVVNKGYNIVEIARSTVGKYPYVWGGESTDVGFDCSGLVYYCYNEAGVSIPRTTVQGYYDQYKYSARSVDEADVSYADLLFYENNSSEPGLDHIAIANGAGGRIHAKNKESGIVEESGLGNPTHILRILADSETGSEVSLVGEVVGISPSDYAYLTSQDPHSLIVSQNLSKVSAKGYDYGYLIDMTNGGEFKFYIPEFTEQAGAQWNPIEIRGRSVTIHSYLSTSSRKINISLDLYAGVGIYTALSGEDGLGTVNRLHKDAYFVKSLEYPDYSNAITRPPATVHLILGSAVSIVGIVSDVSIEHLKPLDSQNRSMYLKLNFTVTQTAVNPPDWRDIRSGQNSIISTSDIDSIYGSGADSNALVYAKEGE